MKALWKGSISFGLVHIRITPDMVHKKDKCTIQYVSACKKMAKKYPGKILPKDIEKKMVIM